jgi:hypothetical protein
MSLYLKGVEQKSQHWLMGFSLYTLQVNLRNSTVSRGGHAITFIALQSERVKRDKLSYIQNVIGPSLYLEFPENIQVLKAW